MPFFEHNNKKVFYDYQPNETQVVVFINGLTHNTSHWAEYRNDISKIGVGTLCFDIPGQGQSEPPEDRLSFPDISSLIEELLNHLEIQKAYFIGISFGAWVALRFAVQNTNRVSGLIAMGGGSEKDTLMKCLCQALIDAIHKGGIEYLFDFLTALNFNHDWIAKNKRLLSVAKKKCVLNNTDTAIRYFLETMLDSPEITEQLSQIDAPVLVMCGENDVLTPRWCQEILRENISNSSMIVIQNVCHAFTIESPNLCKQIFSWFVQQVEKEKWVGDQRAWIALDHGENNFKLIPCNRKKLLGQLIAGSTLQY